MVAERCPDCGIEVDDLLRHRESAHRSNRTFRCPLCNREFSRNDNLLKHIRNVHGNPGTLPEASAASAGAATSSQLPQNPGAAPDDEVSEVIIIDESSESSDSSPVQISDASDDGDEEDHRMEVSNSPGPSHRPLVSEGFLAQRRLRIQGPEPIPEEDSFAWDDTVPFDDDEYGYLDHIYAQNWNDIRTRVIGAPDSPIRTYNLRLPNEMTVENLLERIHAYHQLTSYRVNIQVGYILRNMENDDLRYFYNGINTNVFPEARLIRSRRDFDRLLKALQSTDIETHALHHRESTKWIFHRISNISVIVHASQTLVASGSVSLPSYILNNTGLENFLADSQQNVYDDNLCFFRALARQTLWPNKHDIPHTAEADLWFDGITRDLFHRFYDNYIGQKPPEPYMGVPLNYLDDLEEFFHRPIYVYNLAPYVDPDVLKKLKQKRRKRRFRQPKPKKRPRKHRRKRNPFILDEAEEDGGSDENDEDDENDAEERPDDAQDLAEEMEAVRQLQEEAIAKKRFSALLVRRPFRKLKFTDSELEKALCLNMFEQDGNVHFSRISCFPLYCKRFQCNKECHRVFSTRQGLHRHNDSCKGASVKNYFPGNGFVIQPSIFERLEKQLGIKVKKEDQYYPYYVAYDWESYNECEPMPDFEPIVDPPVPHDPDPLPPLRPPTVVIEPPPDDVTQFERDHWMQLHSRRGTRNDYCVIHRPLFDDLAFYIIAMGKLQSRRFKVSLKFMGNNDGRLVTRSIAKSGEIAKWDDLWQWMQGITAGHCQARFPFPDVIAVRIDITWIKQPFSARLIPASVCLATNTPGFENPENKLPKPHFFLSEGNPRELTKKFVAKLYEISEAAGKIMLKKFRRVLDYLNKRWMRVHLKSMYQILVEHMHDDLPAVERKIEELEQVRLGMPGRNLNDEDQQSLQKLVNLREIYETQLDINQPDSYIERLRTDPDCKGLEYPAKSLLRELKDSMHPGRRKLFYHHRRECGKVRQLYKDLEEWCCNVACFGFNSARFDIALIKKDLFAELMLRKELPLQITVREEGMSELYHKHCNGIKTGLTIIKKAKAYMNIATNRIRFLDISKFISQGTSYSKWLASRGVTAEKFFFPHEYFTSLEVLDEGLPPQREFYSILKNLAISDEDYAKVKDTWEKRGWTTLREHLEYYNSMDVLPFLDGIESMRTFFRDTWDVDMLGGQVVSLPGLAERCLYQTVDPHINFVLPQVSPAHNNRDLHDICRSWIVGGPSIVYNRLMRVGQDRIRDRKKGKLCQNIFGFDANSLYPWASSMPQATQMPKRWDIQADGSFKGSQLYPNTQAEIEWLEWEAYVRNRKIYHRFNGGITLFGSNQYKPGAENKLEREESNPRELRILGNSVDGYCPDTQTCFFFDGCRHHGHFCPGSDDILKLSEKEKNEYKKRQRRDKGIRRDLIKGGYEVVVMTECEWDKYKLTRQNPDPERYVEARQEEMIKEFYWEHFSKDAYDFVPIPEKTLKVREFKEKYFDLPHRERFEDHDDLVEAIRNDQFFGIVVCDLALPKHDRERYRELLAYFEEQTPIWKNVEVSRKDIGKHMRRWAEEHNALENPSRQLIGSYHCTEMAMITPLFRWLVDKGFECSKIHIAFQFKPIQCFKKFVDTCADARRKCDVDEDFAPAADMMKLLVNSIYGKSITDFLRHHHVSILSPEKAEPLLASNYFVESTELSDDWLEIVMVKDKHYHRLNILFGFFVYGYSKLRMLEFHYDFIDRYFKREDYCMLLMDTDSEYIAISAKTLEAIVKPELKDEFPKARERWLGRQTEPGKSYDKRTPGLYKIRPTKAEYEGPEMASLSSKCYCQLIANPDGSLSYKPKAKGVSKTLNELTFESYVIVLETGESLMGRVEQIVTDRITDNLVRLSTQKRALQYAYYKRQVQEDGSTTKPLTI